MYPIKEVVSIHIISFGCYFEDDCVGLVTLDLPLLLEEINSYLLSYWSTISGTNLTWSGPAAAMIDVGDQKNRHIVHYCTKKCKIGRIFEDAQHLCISSFVGG